MSSREDPYGAFRFLVEIGGSVVASFSECSGLQAETEVEEIPEGGVNDHKHRLPKGTKYGNLVLRRGLSSSDDLWKWYSTRAADDFASAPRKSLSVILWDGTTQNQVWRWDFADAFPVKWTGPELKAETAVIAIEAVEFAHEGLTSGGPPGGA